MNTSASPTGKTLLLAGATGAVGREILKQASAHPEVARVIALTRRPLGEQWPKVSNEVVDFSNLPEHAPWWQADAVLCALGTTRKKAGSASAFQAVDLDMPAALAQRASAHQIPCFVLNSSMMANPKASSLYLRTKGQAEQAVIEAGFESVTLARPGLLDAERTENRPGEYVGILASRVFNPVLPKRYRSVPVQRVAQHMLAQALKAPSGVHVLESDVFQRPA